MPPLFNAGNAAIDFFSVSRVNVPNYRGKKLRSLGLKFEFLEIYCLVRNKDILTVSEAWTASGRSASCVHIVWRIVSFFTFLFCASLVVAITYGQVSIDEQHSNPYKRDTSMYYWSDYCFDVNFFSRFRWVKGFSGNNDACGYHLRSNDADTAETKSKKTLDERSLASLMRRERLKACGAREETARETQKSKQATMHECARERQNRDS